MEIKQGDKFILELGKVFNHDDSYRDPVYNILNTNLFITKHNVLQLTRFIDSNKEQDRVNLLYECFKKFITADWKDKHAMLDDESSNVVDMLSKLNADQFIDKVTEYHRDIRVGDICRHKTYGYKCIVLSVEESREGKQYLCAVKNHNNSGLCNSIFSENKLEKIGKSSYGLAKILYELV